MIHITQGHEESIAIETLVKSLQMLSEKQLQNFYYHINKDVLDANLEKLNIRTTVKDNNLYFDSKKYIRCKFIKSSNEDSSFNSILSSLSIINKGDILITPPTSKDKFIYNGQSFAGHTDFLRNYYNKKLTMNFVNDTEQMLILTDHVSIDNVPRALNISNITDQIEQSIDYIAKYFNRKIKYVHISGINPHSGENGLISKKDKIIDESIEILAKKNPHLKFKGPIPGDIQSSLLTDPISTLQVYCHHDQGLSYFKFKNGFIGLNTTFGLDYLRLSVDHGTAQKLYGLNQANPLGSYFVLKNALKIHENTKP